MAWVKVPKEHHAMFVKALPAMPRSTTIAMFGGLAATVNGNIACGLFARSVMLRLSRSDLDEALALDGAAPFDPMGRGAVRSDKVQMPETVMDEPAELRAWLQRALDFTASLPRKAAKKKPAAAKKKPAARRSKQRR